MLTADLTTAIDSCYAAFARSTPPVRIDGCPHCTTPEERAGLLLTPLRRLDAHALERYAFKAVTTIGSVADLRFFWPRLAELSLTGELITDSEVVFGKLAVANWQSWPDSEREALSNLASAISASFAIDVLDERIDTWVATLGRFVTDILPHVDRLLEDTDPARRNRRAFWAENEESVRRDRLANAYWDRASSNHASLLAWCRTNERVLRAAAG